VAEEDRTRFLSDRGSGSLARAFEEYLRTLSIRHIYCAPRHPQTNGKIERFHETLKARMNLLVYTSRTSCGAPCRTSSSITIIAASTRPSTT
jgi:transposase InsO family protein